MADRSGFIGGLFGDDTILWFIILFLLLFCGIGGYGAGAGCGTAVGYKD